MSKQSGRLGQHLGDNTFCVSEQVTIVNWAMETEDLVTVAKPDLSRLIKWSASLSQKKLPSDVDCNM